MLLHRHFRVWGTAFGYLVRPPKPRVRRSPGEGGTGTFSLAVLKNMSYATQELYRRDNAGTEHAHLRKMLVALGSAEGPRLSHRCKVQSRCASNCQNAAREVGPTWADHTSAKQDSSTALGRYQARSASEHGNPRLSAFVLAGLISCMEALSAKGSGKAAGKGNGTIGGKESFDSEGDHIP